MAVNSNRVVVEMHQPSAVSGTIYCQVGQLNRDKVVYREENEAGVGKYPKVAIYNDCVVKVHEGRMLRHIHYDFGRLDDMLCIVWKTQISNSPRICSGRLPAVAVHGNIAVITYDSAIGYNTYYRIGTIDEQGESVNWSEEHKLFRFGATETSVALNQQYVVSAGRGYTKIRYLIGRIVEQNRPQIEGNGHQNRRNDHRIESLLEVKYNHIGYHPSICMNNEGYIIMMWQSRSRRLSYVNGQVIVRQDPHPPVIKWDDVRNHGFGYKSVIALSADNNHVVEEHETNAPMNLALFYCTGVLQKQPIQVEPDAHKVEENGRPAVECENGQQVQLIMHGEELNIQQPKRNNGEEFQRDDVKAQE